MGRVRAKFRVMNVDQQWNGKITQVRLLPVYPKSGHEWDEPDACEENKAFWDATPSGEAQVRFGTIDPEQIPLKLGKAYYVDMAPSAGPTQWKLEVNSQFEHQLDVRLECARQHEEHIRTASITMSINNQSAWGVFKDAGPGGYWSVEFTEAPG